MERITLPEHSQLALEIDPENEKLLGPCACCGEMTSRVWGYAYRSDVAIAAYFVEWTPLHTVVDAMFDLIIGTWGEGTQASDRQAVSVAFRQLESGPSFMVQDASAQNPIELGATSSSRLCMGACDEPVVKLNRLISNCGPGKLLFDALAPCFSELSGLFGICHEI
jgi:hypothetical protein